MAAENGRFVSVYIEVSDTCINLLTIYDKKEISNISEQYINQIIQNLK